MRPFSSTIPFAQARQILLEAAVPIAAVEEVPLADADGRVAAATLRARLDVPPFDRSAMDGYAVVAGDTAGATADAPRTLVCVDRLFAGQAPSRPMGSGECIEIATGAPIPPGADAVVMVEDTARAGDDPSRIAIRAAVSPGQHVGRRGADLQAGAEVVRAGSLLTPSRIGAVAAAGIPAITVYRRPTVAIVSTGNELVEPGRALAPGQIHEVNRFTLASVVRRHGGVATLRPTTADTLEALARAVDDALAHDLIVFSGGSSVGDRDLVLDIVEQRGEIVFHGIAVKPGKPTLFGRIGRTAVLGMPGNPTSCLSNAYMLLAPFLRRMARLPPWEPRTVDAPLARPIASAPGRHQFYTVRLVDGRAEPAFKGSGEITSMANADGYIEIPADVQRVEAGALVNVKIF